MQKKEYQELESSLPDTLIDKVYRETYEQFQQIKKLLSGVQGDDRRALETRLVLEINEILANMPKSLVQLGKWIFKSDRRC